MALHDLIRLDRARRDKTDIMRQFIFDSALGDGYANWRGPIPDGKDEMAQLSTQLKRQYTSYNVLSQVCNDHVNAVAGRDFTWGIDLPEDESEALTAWYDRLELQELFQDALYTLLWARLEEDRRKSYQTSSVLRAFIPRRATPDGVANFPDLRSALMGGVRFMHPEPGSAGMLRDEDGEVIGGYYSYREKDKTGMPRDLIELVTLDTEIARQIEMGQEGWSFDDENYTPDENKPLTVIQVRSGVDFSTIESEMMYPFAGVLTMFEMTRRPFVTDSMLEQQMSLNANETYMNIGGGSATFLERIFTNVLPPGEFVEEDREGRKVKVFKPSPFRYGDNTLNFLQGIPETRADGTATRSTPGVHYHNPTGPGAFTATSQHRVEAIYSLANMRHKLMGSDATASGVSRQQAAQDFISSVSPTQTQAKSGLEWMLRLALQMGAYLSKRRPYENLEIEPKVVVTAVQPTPDEQRVALELYQAQVISLNETQKRVGIEDEEAETQEIEGDTNGGEPSSGGDVNDPTD